MSVTLASASPVTRIEQTGPADVRRLVTVQPGMCGPTALFAARVGDWTWESVSTVCGLDVFNAQDAQGRAAYLAFHYFRIRSGGHLTPERITFGDRLEVITRVFSQGRRSVLTLHRIRRLPQGATELDASFDLEEFHERPRPDCLYVENLNHWLTRGAGHTNVGLVHTPPVGFDHTRLPELPDVYSPKTPCRQARADHRFHDPATAHYTPSGDQLSVNHRVDVTRDINGVGLMYFASFLSIAEGALLELWRGLGRTDRAFLDRSLQDIRICYLGNADLDATLRLHLRLARDPENQHHERADILIQDTAGNRALAVASFRVHTAGPQ